jgi:hypothetical protein
MQARRHALLPLILACALFGSVGCHQGNLIDSPLFLPDADGLERRAALTRPDAIVRQTSATEVAAGKPKPAGAAPPLAPAESLKRLAVTPLGNADRQPAGAALRLALEPRDAAGHVIPVHGNLQIVALQVGPDGALSRLCVWDIPADDLQRRWKAENASPGYQLALPWKAWPVHEELRVVARLCVTGGKLFEADRTVHVLLAAPTAALPQPPGSIGVEPVSHTRGQSPSAAVHLARPVPLRDDE